MSYLVYGIFMPQSEPPIAYMVSDIYPTFEAMGDAVAKYLGFDDRDALLHANPGLLLAALPLQ
jgi:hypothetical protein